MKTNLSAITSLCTKGILLDKGFAPLPIASTEEAIQEYLGTTKLNNIYVASKDVKNQKAWIEEAEISDETGANSGCIRVGTPLVINIKYICRQSIHSLGMGAGISVPGAQE